MTILSWSVKGAVSVSIAPGIGVVAVSGRTTVNPTVPTEYVLSATNRRGVVTTDSIMVYPAVVPAPVGSVPVGSVPVGSVPVGSVPVGSVPVGSVPVGNGAANVTWGPTLVANGAITLLQVTNAAPGATVEYDSTTYNASGVQVAVKPRTFGGVVRSDGTLSLDLVASWNNPTEVSAQNHVFIGGLGVARILFTRVMSAPVGSVPVGSVPVGSVPVGSVPVGSVPVGSVPVGTTPIYNETFTTPVPEIYAGTALTLNINGGKPNTNFVLTSPNGIRETFTLNSGGSFTLTRVVVLVQEQSAARIVNAYSVVFAGTGNSRYLSYVSVRSPQYVPPVGSVPVGSVPVGSVPVGSVPVGSVPVGSVPVGGPIG